MYCWVGQRTGGCPYAGSPLLRCRNGGLELLRHRGIEAEERRISVDELVAAARDGSLEECWGSGTAAVISPVGTLRFGDEVMEISGGGITRIETNKRYVTDIEIRALAHIFGVTCDYLIEGEKTE